MPGQPRFEYFPAGYRGCFQGGFREGRSCADALGQCFNALAKSYSPQWILEGDIKSCFDEISQPWLLDHIPMDREILELWLKAGFMENQRLFPSRLKQGDLRRFEFGR